MRVNQLDIQNYSSAYAHSCKFYAERDAVGGKFCGLNLNKQYSFGECFDFSLSI